MIFIATILAHFQENWNDFHLQSSSETQLIDTKDVVWSVVLDIFRRPFAVIWDVGDSFWRLLGDFDDIFGGIHECLNSVKDDRLRLRELAENLKLQMSNIFFFYEPFLYHAEEMRIWYL